MSEAATVQDCERFHREMCEQLAAHDKRVDDFSTKLDRVVDAELSQAASLDRTQLHLEGAAKELEQAARTINAQSNCMNWMQGEISASRTAAHKENRKLISAVVAVLIVLAGLKAGGVF